MKPKALFHEVALYAAGRPAEFLIGYGSQFFGPVSYLPLNQTYFVNDPMIAKTILTDTEHFSLNSGGGLGYLIGEVMGHDQPALFNMEGPAHVQMKTLMMSVFRADYLQKIIEEALEPELKQAQKQYENEGFLDVVRLSKRCTTRLSCHMIGITAKEKGFEALLSQVSDLSDQLTSMLSITTTYPTLQQKAKGQAIYSKFCSLIEQYYSSKQLPDNSVMKKMKEKGLSFDEAKSLLVTLVIAGTETVASSLPRILALSIDDEKWSILAKDPAQLSMLISEGLRITSPAPAIVHGVKKDITVGNYSFKANRRIMIMLLNILRNNAFFPNALEIKLDRKYDPRYQTFWFGAGPHYCLGAQLAKLEIQYVLSYLLGLGSKPRIRSRKYTIGSSFPGYSQLVVQFDS